MSKAVLLKKEDEVLEEALKIEMEAFDIITARVGKEFQRRRKELSPYSRVHYVKHKSFKISKCGDVNVVPKGRYHISDGNGWYKVIKKRRDKNE